MVVIENTTIFKCEYCRKNYQIKGYCEKHEEWCCKNPKNFKVCHSCSYLSKENRRCFTDLYNGVHYFNHEVFICTKINKGVYPLSVEKRQWEEPYQIYDVENIPMVSECVDFKRGDFI